jgi:hypothetical protein
MVLGCNDILILAAIEIATIIMDEYIFGIYYMVFIVKFYRDFYSRYSAAAGYSHERCARIIVESEARPYVSQGHQQLVETRSLEVITAFQLSIIDRQFIG